MSAPSASNRVRPVTLEDTVTTLPVPGLGVPRGIFVLADGTRLVSSSNEKIFVLLPSWGRLTTLAGNKDEVEELKDGEGISTRFKDTSVLTVDRVGSVVVVDYGGNTIRKVTKAGSVVSTLTDNGETGFPDGQGTNTHFNRSHRVVVAANGDFIVSDCLNHLLRLVTPEGAVRTLVGNGQSGFVDGQGADTRSTRHLLS